MATFKTQCDNAAELCIEPSVPARTFFIDLEVNGFGRRAAFPIEHAEAIALAVLEGAGHSAMTVPAFSLPCTGAVVADLQAIINRKGVAAREAAALKALEREALELCLLTLELPSSNGWPPVVDKGHWVKVARAARALRKVSA